MSRSAALQDFLTLSEAALLAAVQGDAAEAADRVLVLHKGKLLADGTPAEVTAALGGPTLEDAFLKATT